MKPSKSIQYDDFLYENAKKSCLNTSGVRRMTFMDEESIHPLNKN